MHPLNDVPDWHQPYPFWFWNGEMTVAEVARQITVMREAGITEFVLHPRTGLVTPFLSDAWFDAVQGALEAAKRHGMRVWIYDEFNWPSGNAKRTITADPAKREHYLDADNVLHAEPDPFGPASVDYLNPACTREFIARCYQPYYEKFKDYFGTTIAGVFNDEVRFCNPRPWSPALDEPVPEGSAYRQRLGELMNRHYFTLLRDWCRERGVEFTGHVMGEETLGSQTRYMGNAWDIIATFDQPGCDHLGSAAQGHHPRLPASIGQLTGNRMITSETFAALPWDCTPEDLYRISGWLYANGITRILLHGFFYTRDGGAARDWPPDLFFHWEHWDAAMPDYLRWAGRVQYFLARATPRCRVALYYPYQEFLADFAPAADYKLNYTDAAPVGGSTAVRYHLAFGELMNAMIRRGIDFEIVPRHLLDQVSDHLLVTPLDSNPDFAGQVIRQGDRTEEACIAELDAALGRRVRVSGTGASPHPQLVSPRLSDPYLHTGQDDGGVWIKEFSFAGQPAVLLWNANDHAFTGTLDLVEQRPWRLWTPLDGRETDLGNVETCAITLPAHHLAIVLAQR